MASSLESIYGQMLVIRSQAGDETAFRELFSIYAPRLLQFTRQMLQSLPERIEELTQDLWVTLFRRLPSLRDAAKFKPWAFRIARDLIYAEYRRRHVFGRADESEMDELPAPGGDHDLPLEELRLCLDMIPPTQREAVVLCYLEGMNYEEISRVTGAAPGTVRSRIYYAKRALKQAMEHESYENRKADNPTLIKPQ